MELGYNPLLAGSQRSLSLTVFVRSTLRCPDFVDTLSQPRVGIMDEFRTWFQAKLTAYI
jgi:hypothetical protein